LEIIGSEVDKVTDGDEKITPTKQDDFSYADVSRRKQTKTMMKTKTIFLFKAVEDDDDDQEEAHHPLP
jgi:hypothetical protein